jgi:flavin reductase (DIM6/NTAB) family NADH-FMN oxidoreductase RutF
METAAAQMPHREIYKLLTGCIVPRPIAWVSTVDSDGNPNLAPFSFFTAVCSNPPTVLFCPGVRAGDLEQKDTLHNIRATGEFIINFVTETLAEQMNITSAEVPAHVNEFERAGLTAVPGVAVKVPRVAESPIHFECQVQQIIPISAEPGGGNIVVGTIVHLHCDESIWREGNYIDTLAYQPVGRLAGAGYSRTRDLFDMKRPPSEIEPKTS